jgi:hypothetical protein
MNGKRFYILLTVSVLASGCTTNKVAWVEPQGVDPPMTRGAAADYLLSAEAWRDRGSAKAKRDYELAIEANPTNAFNRFAYAEYLRQYRGAEGPLLPKAAEYYDQTIRLLNEAPARNDELYRNLDMSLTDLSQRDGMALLHWPLMATEQRYDGRRPVVFFSSQFDTGDQEIPIRDLTSSLLFTEVNAGRQLTENERQSLVRPKNVMDWLNRIRVRPPVLPWIDVWWRTIEACDALPNFQIPIGFHDYHEDEWGAAIERSFDFFPFFDLGVRAGYRESTVNNDVEETGSAWFGALAIARVFPGWFGPNKVTVTFQHEETDIDGAGYFRAGMVSAAAFKYSIYPRSQRDKFVLRSTDLETGWVWYRQEYGDADVDQYDYYTAVTLRQIPFEKLDLSAWVTLFDEQKDHSDSDWEHRQIRYSLTPLWRVSDNENSTDPQRRYRLLRFLNLYAPLDYTEALDGPDDFESYAYGIGVAAKIAWTGPYHGTLLFSSSLLQRDYYNLDESETLWNISIKLGF